MLSHLSWSDYIQTLLWLLAIYYAYVLLRYYRQEMTSLLLRKPKAMPAAQPAGKPNTLAIAMPYEQPPVLPSNHPGTPLIQTLKDEVAAFIPEAVSNGFEKEALLSSLAFILSKYSSPDIVLYRDDIQQWILDQCRTHSSARISESELACLWNS